MADPVPPRVHRFIERHITSVSELELLILLVRDGRGWTAREIEAQMVLGSDHVAVLLDSLLRTGLTVKDDDRYRFGPRTEKDRAAAKQLAAIYDRYRVRILNILFSRPGDQIRGFADAFRLRKPAEDIEHFEDDEEGEE